MKESDEAPAGERPAQAEAAPVTKATILVNPAARKVPGRFDGRRAVRYLAQQGVDATVVVPEGRAEMTIEARKAAERGDDLLFAVGGDGTQRDAAMGLAGSATALAPIRAGTTNVLAREAGIPGGLRAAFDAHLAGQTVRMDVGRADDTGFLMMAGIGWDARVAGMVPAGLKRLAGPAAYVLQGLRMLLWLRPRPARWLADGESFEGPLAVMVVSNTRSYGGAVSFAPRARANDGLLDVVALCPETPLDGARLSARLLARRLEGDTCAVTRRVAEVVFETPGLPVQLDGDYAGETPMRFSVDAGALLLRVPAGLLPGMLNHEGHDEA